MNLRRTFTVVMTILACVTMVGNVMGQPTINTFLPTNGVWSDEDNWSEGIVPAADHDVIIPAGKNCDVDITNAVAASFELDNGGNNSLNILTGQKLTIDGTGTADATHDIHTGTVELRGSGELQFTSVNHTITGNGRIEGQSNSAKLTSATSGKTLTNSIGTTGIIGRMVIGGAGNFTNNGIVRADAAAANDELLIKLAGTLDDTSGGGRWRTTTLDADCKLVFDTDTGGTIAYMQGEFLVPAGTVVINKALTTAGRLEISGGMLDVQQDTVMGDTTLGSTNNLLMTGGQIKVAVSTTFTHN